MIKTFYVLSTVVLETNKEAFEEIELVCQFYNINSDELSSERKILNGLIVAENS